MADIHGNDVALRAVLTDAGPLGVDRWWALGDLVLFGPRPAELLQAGLIDELAALPAQLRLHSQAGATVLGVHASPQADDGQGIEPGVTDEVLGALLAGCDADVVIDGHAHLAANAEFVASVLTGKSCGNPAGAVENPALAPSSG